MKMELNVLIVEDDTFIANLISGHLERKGFNVELVLDGEAALKKLKKEIPDIILLDLILPRMSGFDVLEKLKKDEKLKDIPVVILSNLGSGDEIQKGLQMGAEAYFVKAHVLPEDVVKKIEEIAQRESKKK